MTASPKFFVKQLADLYIRKNFQALEDYFRELDSTPSNPTSSAAASTATFLSQQEREYTASGSLGTEGVVLLNASRASLTLTLPALSASQGRCVWVLRTDTSTTTSAEVKAATNDLINGAINLGLLSQGSWALLYAGETQWQILGSGGTGSAEVPSVLRYRGWTGYATEAGSLCFRPGTLDEFMGSGFNYRDDPTTGFYLTILETGIYNLGISVESAVNAVRDLGIIRNPSVAARAASPLSATDAYTLRATRMAAGGVGVSTVPELHWEGRLAKGDTIYFQAAASGAQSAPAAAGATSCRVILTAAQVRKL